MFLFLIPILLTLLPFQILWIKPMELLLVLGHLKAMTMTMTSSTTPVLLFPISLGLAPRFGFLGFLSHMNTSLSLALSLAVATVLSTSTKILDLNSLLLRSSSVFT